MSDAITRSTAIFCVFRRGTMWFAFPAETVREVMERPGLVSVPGNTDVLAGLCHVRSEFTPVVRLNRLLTEDSTRLPDEQQMLVMNHSDGAWGVLADEVRALVHLEPSAGEDVTDQESWTAVITGWAAWNSESVRVLHAGNLRDLIETQLGRSWTLCQASAESAV